MSSEGEINIRESRFFSLVFSFSISTMSVIDEVNLLPDYNQTKLCRICLNIENPNDMISPCLCSGNSSYVHRKCLNNYRTENANGKTFKFCNICHFEYIIETVINNPEVNRKYHLFVIRDLISMVLLIQLIIFGLAYLLKILDNNNHSIKNLYPESIKEFIIYYFSAIVLFTCIVTIISICNVVDSCVGILLSVIVLKQIIKNHTSRIWLRQEAEKYIVKDLKDELINHIIINIDH